MRYEAVPRASAGYVWSPGYWDWQLNRHVWVRGSWKRSRPGYVYAQPHWVNNGGQWRFQQGAWARGDLDHDGVPNRADRDRDGDGIPNQADPSPNHAGRGGPPPVRYEPLPSARLGYVWSRGFWNWNNNQHVWVGGAWMRERPGYVYAQPRWVNSGDRWVLQQGAWARGDIDHDGVPNRADRDRDGDGVRNGVDPAPNDARR